MKLEEIWSERDLIARLNLKASSKSNRSTTLGRWISMGLPYYKYSDRRWFAEQDVVEFIVKQFKKGYDMPRLKVLEGVVKSPESL